MRDDWDKLEREVEAGMDALGERFDVATPRDVIGRARLAARVALDERWLDSTDISITPALRERLRATVRREMGRGSPAAARLDWFRRNTRGLSALASAAMIGICVGVIHHAGSLSGRSYYGDGSVESLVDPGAEVYPSDRLTASLDDDLKDLEERIVEGPAEDRVEEGLRQLEEVIDTLQKDLSIENGTL